MTNREKFCAEAQKQVDNGSIYVLGAQGQTGSQITEAWIKKREHNKLSNYKRAIKLWLARQVAGFKKLRAFDCSGFVLWLLAQLGLYDGTDRTANGIYFNLCDAISKSDLEAGDLVFKRYSYKNKMYHVGIYMGNGTVAHCKGRDDGCVIERISATGWNRFGRLKCMGSATAGIGYNRMLKLEYRAKAATKLYAGASSKTSALKAIKKNASVAYMGKHGSWLYVYYNGKTGYVLASTFTRCAYQRGADVKAVQTALKAAGYDPGDIDSVAGPLFAAAVVAFQKAKSLEVDSIVGPITWAALGL